MQLGTRMRHLHTQGIARVVLQRGRAGSALGMTGPAMGGDWLPLCAGCRWSDPGSPLTHRSQTHGGLGVNRSSFSLPPATSHTMDPACQYQQAAYPGDEDLLACSPLCSLLSPSCTADGTAWAGKFTLTDPGASGAVGCKRKAHGADLTPCSSLANLTDCPGQGGRGGEYALTAPAFRCVT